MWLERIIGPCKKKESRLFGARKDWDG